MDILTIKPLAKNITFDSDNIWVELTDGRKIGVPLGYFPRLLNASPDQLKNYVISGGGTGLHWDELDEDISVKSLLMGIGDQTHHVDNLRKKPCSRVALQVGLRYEPPTSQC